MSAEGPLPMTPLRPSDFNSYLEAQARNLSEVRRLPEFNFVERVIELYDHSFTLLTRPHYLGRRSTIVGVPP